MGREILKRFNMSYSAYSTYKKSQLEFYFKYIAKSEPTEKALPYGDAGNVVHGCMEDHITSGTVAKSTYIDKWREKDLFNQKGFQGVTLSYEKYYDYFNNGVSYYNEIPPATLILAEKRIEMLRHGMNIKSFIDLYLQYSGFDGYPIVIYDWKTNSQFNKALHRDQRLFYSWVIYENEGIIPNCKWYYLKHKEVVSDHFDLSEIQKFDVEIARVINEIAEKGDDISKYETGTWKHPFNQCKKLCQAEIDRRITSNNLNLTLEIRGHYVFIVGDAPQKLFDGIDLTTQFDLPDKYFMQEAVKKKGGMFNLKDVGTVHLFNMKNKCFPIGMKSEVTNIIFEYGEYYKNFIILEVKDCRDINILNSHPNIVPKKLCTTNVLRDYQKEAVDIFMKEESGIINIATGGGKTFIASEIIRQANAQTLWIIDRKELLDQTKKVLETLLCCEIGEVCDGVLNLCPITIATIQSLSSKISDPAIQKYLQTVNMVVVDEYHKAAAESYQKIFCKIPNAKYRLGLTATATRDDGKEKILFSILGGVIYKVDSKQLIDEGYLIKPKIRFHELDLDYVGEHMTYPEEYTEKIVDNATRNNTIKLISVAHAQHKQLILTKTVEHGKHLAELLDAKHIHGSLGKKVRQKIMSEFRENPDGRLVITNSIGAEGLDIPDLDVIINAGANKGDVKSIQILGRLLRNFLGKSTAYYYDFIDSGKHTRSHSLARIKAFEEQGHEVTRI